MNRASLVLILLTITGCVEPEYRQYHAVTAALASGENEDRGLPNWLPASATELYLQGKVRTGNRLRADLTPAAADSLRALLVPIDADRIRVSRPQTDKDWWFEGLIQQQPENDAALNADLFRGNGSPVPQTTVVAFDRLSPRVYVWTNGTR